MSDYANLTVSKHYADDGAVSYTAEWQGPATILISHELMDDHDPAVMQRDGNNLSVCQYRLRITGRTQRGDYIAERVPTLYIVGQNLGGENLWEFLGVYDTEELARVRCTKPNHFYAPALLNQELPDEAVPWIGIVYPLVQVSP